MICPHCSGKTKVVRTYTRAGEVQRERSCVQCGRLTATTERPDDVNHGIEAQARRVLRDALADMKELGQRC